MLRQTQIFLWRAAALISLAVGIVGVVLPILPTAPFLIVAAWAGGKGWPALEQWLLDHAHFGPQIRAWRERGVVPRKAKLLATLGMCASATGLQFFAVSALVRFGVPAVMMAVALWLWRRPEA